MNGSMSSQLPSLTSSPRTHDAGRSISVVVSQPPLNGKFACPNCPRTFTGQAKARFILDIVGYLHSITNFYLLAATPKPIGTLMSVQSWAARGISTFKKTYGVICINTIHQPLDTTVSMPIVPHVLVDWVVASVVEIS
jgi:hypothetical protein